MEFKIKSKVFNTEFKFTAEDKDIYVKSGRMVGNKSCLDRQNNAALTFDGTKDDFQRQCRRWLNLESKTYKEFMGAVASPAPN